MISLKTMAMCCGFVFIRIEKNVINKLGLHKLIILMSLLQDRIHILFINLRRFITMEVIQMRDNKKTENNNQWAGPNVEITEKSHQNQKDATNNQWTSTNKKA